MVFLTRPGSRALLPNISLFYYSKTDFSFLMHTFASSFVNNTVIGSNDNTIPIHDLYLSFHEKIHYQQINLNKIIESCEGHLKLYFITNNNTKKHLDSCVYKEKKYYMLKGVYFTPFSYNFVKNENIQGMMLDTTRSVLKNYFVSIPTFIIKNVGLPIGFGFGKTEDFAIYDDFFKVFMKFLFRLR